ncbi:MAG: TatD family hydrolase [Bacteroidetes bacterium]|nr:TatD family hydrolase [Bacteroidota bacterium]
MIDTHTHLFADEFLEDRTATITRAIEAGVSKMLLPNIDVASIEALKETAALFPENCLTMMGLHPCSVKENYEAELAIIKAELFTNKYIAIGETGLDYYWDTTFAEQQKLSLQTHINWAKELNLPIVLHTRNSFDDTYNLIAENHSQNLSGVFHCFSGTLEEAEKLMALKSFYMGIGGVVTFKNGGLDKVLPHIPLQYLLLETDSPYLAPVPYRGKRNESSYLPIIAQRIAEIKECSVEEVIEVTTENANRLFGLS